MRLILVVVIFIQFQGYEQNDSSVPMKALQKDNPSFPINLKVPPGMYELRRISNDAVRSINSGRIITVNQNQGQGPPNTIRTQNEYQPIMREQQAVLESHRHPQSGDISIPALGGPQDYMHVQRGYQSEVGSGSPTGIRQDYIQREHLPHEHYHAVHQHSVPVRSSGSGDMKDYIRAYNPQAQLIPHKSPQSELIPVSELGNRPNFMEKHQHYQIVSESSQNAYPPQSRLQESTEGYHVINEGDLNAYIQSQLQGPPQSPQQAPQNYQVNETPQPGPISISLPSYGEAANPQGYTQRSQQFSEGYQVVNEGPVAHVVSPPASGSAGSAFYLPQSANDNSQTQLIPIPDNGKDYTVVQNAYYQQQATPDNYPPTNENIQYPTAEGKQNYSPSQNEVYAPYERSYIPQAQQPEGQHTSAQIPYLDGTTGSTQQTSGKLFDMIRGGQMVSNLPPIWPYRKHP